MNNENNNSNVLGSVDGTVNNVANNQNVNPSPMPNPNPNPNPSVLQGNPVESLGGLNSNPNNLNTNNVNQMNNLNQANPEPQINNLGTLNNNPINEDPLINQNNINTPNNNVNLVDNNVTNNIPNGSAIQTPPNPVEPTPAFTNPQTINPGPMPGFENSNAIGTTPPISLEPEKAPKKKSNKLPFILIVLVVLAAVGFGTFYVLRYTNLLNNNNAKIQIETKDLEINLNDQLSANIADYATITGTATSNCSIDTLNVDTTKEGTYEYTILCGETRKTGTIKVVDNTELEVTAKTVYKGKGETLEPKEFAKDNDSNLTFEFVNNEEVNNILNGEVGTYTIKLKVSSNNKTSEIDGKLVIVEKPVKGYLTCSSNPQNINDVNATMTVREKFAISGAGTTNTYGGFGFEIHEFAFSDFTEYNNYVAKYKTDKSITINGITGDASFDDSTQTITITNDLDNNKIMSEYGNSTFETYSSLSAYFRDTLGYNCRYDK